MRTSSSSLAFIVLALIGGCPSTPAPTPDAASNVDAFTAPDAAVQGTCGGMAMGCETRTMAACAIGGGCMAAACLGTPTACGTFSNAMTCRTQSGCGWTGTSCFGAPAACTQSVEAVCTGRMGCRWDPTAATECTGTPGACSAIAPGLCASVSGCLLDAPDAGPTRDAPRPPRDAPRIGTAVVTVSGGSAFANCTPASDDPVVAFWNVQVTGAMSPTATLVSATLNIVSRSGRTLSQTLMVDNTTIALVDGGGTVMMRKTSGTPAAFEACGAAFCGPESPTDAFIDLVFMVDGDRIEASFTQVYLCGE